jgi:protein TonB
MQRSKRKEEDSEKKDMIAAGQDSGDVDTLVSGFLGELATLSSDKSEVQQPEANKEKNVESASKPKLPQSGSTEWHHSTPTIALESIEKEIQESLDQLERLKYGILPDMERNDPQPESAPSAATAEKIPAAAPVRAAETVHVSPSLSANAGMPAKAPVHASTTWMGPAKPPEIREEEEQLWNRLKLLRREVASSGRFPWLKTILGAAILATILGIAGYQLSRLRTGQNSPVAGRTPSAPDSVRQGTDFLPAVPASQIGAGSVTPAPPQRSQPAPSPDKEIARPEEEIARTVAPEANTRETEDIPSAEVTPGMPESADKTPLRPPATSDNKILLPHTGEHTLAQLAAPASEHLEPLQPRSQPLIAAPAQSRALVPAVPISQPGPPYPESASRRRTSASVVLELLVDERGRVARAIPVSGPVQFHSAAVAAVLKWRYKPATIDGKSVASQVRATVDFSSNKQPDQ